MDSDHLVCAACSGLVAAGRCPTCRASRARLDAERTPLPAAALLLVAALMMLLVLVLS